MQLIRKSGRFAQVVHFSTGISSQIFIFPRNRKVQVFRECKKLKLNFVKKKKKKKKKLGILSTVMESYREQFLQEVFSETGKVWKLGFG